MLGVELNIWVRQRKQQGVESKWWFDRRKQGALRCVYVCESDLIFVTLGLVNNTRNATLHTSGTVLLNILHRARLPMLSPVGYVVCFVSRCWTCLIEALC